MPNTTTTPTHSVIGGFTSFVNNLATSITTGVQTAGHYVSDVADRVVTTLDPILDQTHQVGEAVRDIGYIGAALTRGRSSKLIKIAEIGMAMSEGSEAIRSGMYDTRSKIAEARDKADKYNPVVYGQQTYSQSRRREEEEEEEERKRAMRKPRAKRRAKKTSNYKVRRK